MVFEITPTTLRQEGDPAKVEERNGQPGPDSESGPESNSASPSHEPQPQGRRKKKQQGKQLSAYHRDALLCELWRRLEKKTLDQDVDMGDGRTLRMEPKNIIITPTGGGHTARMVYTATVETEVEL